MADTQDLKQAAIDVVAKIAGTAAGAGAQALNVPAPLVVLVAHLGEQEAAALIEWLLQEGQAAMQARTFPDKIEVQATGVHWRDTRQVIVNLNGQPRFVPPGPYMVQQLKAKLHVPHDAQLVQVLQRPTADGHRNLLELGDDANVAVSGNEIFESHPRA